MIDWKETLKLYARYIKWHINIIDEDLCKYYQNNLRYYND